MRVVVLGGSGFIGRHVVNAFAGSGHDVVATYNTRKPAEEAGNLEWVQCDLRQGFAFEENDVVIHCAAVTSGINDTVNRPQIHVADNVFMNTSLFRDAADAQVKHFIFMSSSLVYKSNQDPLREEDLSTDFSGEREKYFGVGWMKIYAEKLCEFYSRFSSTQFTVLRPANIYGPYDKFDLERSHVMGATVRKCLEAKRSANHNIIIWGDGTEGRDLLFVEDLVDCVKRVVGKADLLKKFDVFNVGNGNAKSIRQIVLSVCQSVFIDQPFSLQFDSSKPSGKTWLSLNSDKAENVLGWKPSTLLSDGIKKTYQWCEENY